MGVWLTPLSLHKANPVKGILGASRITGVKPRSRIIVCDPGTLQAVSIPAILSMFRFLALALPALAAGLQVGVGDKFPTTALKQFGCAGKKVRNSCIDLCRTSPPVTETDLLITANFLFACLFTAVCHLLLWRG